MKMSGVSPKLGTPCGLRCQSITFEAEDEEEQVFLSDLLRALVMGPGSKAASLARKLATEFHGQPNETGSGPNCGGSSQ